MWLITAYSRGLCRARSRYFVSIIAMEHRSVLRHRRRGLDSAARRVWLPTGEQVAGTLRRFFVCVPDPFECLRSQVVGKAVAHALGCNWSPALATMVKAELVAMGCRLCVFESRRLVAGIRPVHFDRADAVRVSMQLRGRKTPPKDTGAEI